MSNKAGTKERFCILSKRALSRECLVRFVVSPAGAVTPDLKGNLPGRGVWVEARRTCIAEAVEKKLFAKAFKREVAADAALPDLVGRLLKARALEALAMARKAGQLTSGFTKVESAARTGKAILILHAADAARDGRRKIGAAIKASKEYEGMPGFIRPKAMVCLESQEMGTALGLENVMHAAAFEGGAARHLIAAIERLERYDSDPDMTSSAPPMD